METFLQVDNISKSFGDLMLFEDISFSVLKYQKTALIAANGTGKTTLLNIIANRESPDSGKIIFKNDIRVSYLPQNPEVDETKTALEFVLDTADEIAEAIKKYELALATGDNLSINEAMDLMDATGAWDYDAKVKKILTKLKIFQLDKRIGEMSGGQKKRVAMANILAKEPDFLILDEPTNHLDLEIIEWLEDYLTKAKITLLMVTHDRYFLDRVCNTILELSDNTIYKYNGNYSYYLQKRAERIQLQKEQNLKLKNYLKKEAEWIRRMPQARATKAKYRVDKYYSLSGKLQNHIDKSIDINFVGRRIGKKILELKNVSFSYDDCKILEDFSYSFTNGEKIGIVGNNGTGKTTFLNLITGKLQPNRGEIQVGQTIVFGYYEQAGLKFDENQRVIDVIKSIADVVHLGDGRQMSASQFLEYFLFPHSKHYVKVEKLSGGERKRLYLMTVLMKNPNFLILDEPTNDLDIMTLNVLEDFIESFQGCVLVVSHDRYFMDKIVDGLFVFEGNAQINFYVGKYSEFYYFQLRQKQQQPKAEKKTKSKQKPKSHQKKKGLTYKEKLLMEQLSKEIEQLNKQKQSIIEEIEQGRLDFEQLNEKSKLLEKVNTELDQKEMQWLELSEKDE